MTKITKIALGNNGPQVSKLGLGCMRMSSVWGGPTNDENESIATIQLALDSGINFLNTGDFYGHGHNELLVGKAIKGRRDDAFISVKFGAIFDGGRWLGLDLRPIAIRNFINYSLVRLGIDTIDLYQPCRLDNSVPVEKGGVLLIRKNQLGQLTKTPLPGEGYETIVISLQEELLRKIALEEQIEMQQKYTGPANILIPDNDFLRGYFQSIIPYVRNPAEKITADMGILKIREAVKLLLHAKPGVSKFLFDFSEPYKIDLEKFMLSNFHFNVTVEKFAQLTGRSLAGFKRDFKRTFDASPRPWLLERRLIDRKSAHQTVISWQALSIHLHSKDS